MDQGDGDRDDRDAHLGDNGVRDPGTAARDANVNAESTPYDSSDHDSSDHDAAVDAESAPHDATADGIGHTQRTSGFGSEVDDERVVAVRSFVDAVPSPTLAVDPDTNAIHAANDPAAALLGRDRSTLTLMGLTDIGDPTTGNGESVEEVFNSVVGSGGSTTFEWEARTPNGETRWLEVRAHTASIADRDWLVVALSNATGRIRSERVARDRLRTLESVSTTVPTSLFQCDAGGTLTRWNDRLASDTGYTAEELSGRALPDLFSDSTRSTVADALAEVYAEGDRVEREATLLTRSGERTPYRVTVGPVIGSDGSPVGVVGIGEDRTEASLRDERLAVLTRVLRHNFRNELNVVTGFTRQVKRDVDDPETVAQLDRVLETAGRLLHLGEMSRRVERLLANQPTPGPIPLASVVSDALESVPAEIRERADVETDVSPDLTVSAVDQLSDALAELIDNAIRHNDADRPRVHVAATEFPSESWVSLVVADDGPGIPATERAVLTGEEKPLDHASGLGLWYVNWVVTAGGGELAITESKGGGTRIELSLRTPNAD